MKTPDLDSLIQAWCDDRLTPPEADALNAILRSSPEARESFREATRFHGLLHCAASKWVVNGIADQFAQGAISPVSGPRRAWLKWGNFASMAAGIAITLLCAPHGFGDKPPRILSRSSLLAASEENEIPAGPLPAGFPRKFGQWSGDESAMFVQPGSPSHAPKFSLLFQKAEREKTEAASKVPAACDVFQLVDLRPLKAAIAQGEVTLELAAKFLDARVQSGEKVIFVARLYAFSGRPERIAEQWSIHSRNEALSYASNQFESQGGTLSPSRNVRTVTTLHPDTDFALVHLIAFKPGSDGTAAAEFREQSVQEVQITASTRSSSTDWIAKSKP
ncbi:MAG: hypothetical protein RLZZ399_2165 [Verrucomicrobiota bacterium]|jgi:hypothetical protein